MRETRAREIARIVVPNRDFRQCWLRPQWQGGVEGIAQSLHYVWSKEFLEAGKRRLAGDTTRAATTDEVKGLHRESTALKEVVAEQALELRLLKKRRLRI